MNLEEFIKAKTVYTLLTRPMVQRMLVLMQNRIGVIELTRRLYNYTPGQDQYRYIQRLSQKLAEFGIVDHVAGKGKSSVFVVNEKNLQDLETTTHKICNVKTVNHY